MFGRKCLARRIPDEETLKQQVNFSEVERNNWLCHVYDQRRPLGSAARRLDKCSSTLNTDTDLHV